MQKIWADGQDLFKTTSELCAYNDATTRLTTFGARSCLGSYVCLSYEISPDVAFVLQSASTTEPPKLPPVSVALLSEAIKAN